MEPYDVGAQQQKIEMRNHSGWQPIATAPRDGTIVEVKCVYGVAPWYGLHQFADCRWREIGDARKGFTEDHTFFWRPYVGAADNYIDPTNGAQRTNAYWRGAVASKYGLPADHFEKEFG